MTRCRPILWLGCGLLVMRLAVSQTSDAPAGALEAIRPEVIRADMGFLADDLLEGRAPGTRGYDVGAAYVASRFAALGLKPVSGSSYFQPVPLRSMQLDEAGTTLSLHDARGTQQSLVLRQDFLMKADPGRATAEVDAPLVFVGYGVTAPEQHHDDYDRIDVRGKIVVAVYGAPDRWDPAVKAHYSATWLKRRNAAAHGAVGYLVLYSQDLEKMYPFAKASQSLGMPQMVWLGPAGEANDYTPQLQCAGSISLAGGAKLFAGSRLSSEAALQAAKRGQSRSFPLALSARVHTETHSKDLHSSNVVGVLDGADPTLKSEYVVYSAHLDHLGIGPPVGGDAIYNGALDNASGVAAILSVAEGFAHAAVRPKRSILFVAVTGEESGLLGSDYFAHFPPVPVTSLVANVNVDGAVPLWPVADLLPLGAEHSSLMAPVQAAATRFNLTVSRDSHPEEVYFIRSDQYSFVRQGIPSVFIGSGMMSSDASIDTESRQQAWDAATYHEPSDDMNQPNLNYDSAATLAKVDFLTGWSVANEAARPRWNPGDFFGRAFGGTTTGR